MRKRIVLQSEPCEPPKRPHMKGTRGWIGRRNVIATIAKAQLAFSALGNATEKINDLNAFLQGSSQYLASVVALTEKLDTAADFAFVGMCFIKLLPVLEFPLWMYLRTGMIALIKFVNVISGLAIQKKFVALHTAANKITGAILFAMPMTVGWMPVSYSGGIVCAAATLAAIQEGHFIRTGRGNV